MFQSTVRNWPVVRPHKGFHGETRFEVDLGLVDGRRIRKTFRTVQDAEAYARKARKRREAEGKAGFGLTDRQRAEAALCFAKLKAHGISLSQATDYALQRLPVCRSAPTVKEIAEQMVDQAFKNERDPRTVEDLRYRLGRFSATFGHRKLHEIQLKELEDWLCALGKSPRSRINFRTKVIQLYNYAQRHGWVSANTAENIAKPRVKRAAVGVLTVEQVVSLLRHAPAEGLGPYVILGLFGGLRREEIEGLDWSACIWDGDGIWVDEGVAKTRSRRVVRWNPTLKAWLEPYRHARGPVMSRRLCSKRWRRLLDAAGIKTWPHNAQRHSFGSYSLAKYGEFATIRDMGHCDYGMLHRHYKALVAPSAAEAYWALRPKTSEPADKTDNAQGSRASSGVGSTELANQEGAA